MLQNIRISGEYGQMVIDGEDFKLVDGLDLSAMPTDVNFIETIADGGVYQNTRFAPRPISMEIQIRHRFTDQITQDLRRRNLYSLFNPKSGPFTIEFEDASGEGYYIEAYLTSTPTIKPDRKNNNAAFQKMLLQFIALDPFVYSATNSSFSNNDVTSLFEFPLEITTPGIPLGETTANNIIEIISDSNLETGLIVTVEFFAETVNFRITNTITNEFIQVNDTFQNGDVLTINTNQNKKSVRLRRGGSDLNYLNRIRTDSKFIQVVPGNNSFRLTANEGSFANVVCNIQYREKFLGV